MAFLYSNFSLDKVCIKFDKLCNPSKDSNYIIQKVSNINENFSHNSNINSSFRIGNLSNGKNRQLRICENLKESTTTISGSLSKFENGNNLNTISMDSIPILLLSIGKELGFNSTTILKGVLIKELEYCLSLEVKQPVTEYLNAMLEMKGQCKCVNYGSNKKNLPKETKIYKTGSWSFIGYDKVQEMKINSTPLPQQWENKYILRLEKKLKSRKAIRGLLCKDIQVRDISSTAFKKACIEDFMKSYNKIAIIGNIPKNIDLTKLSELDCLRMENPRRALAINEMRYKEGKIQKANYYNQKKRILYLAKEKTIKISEELNPKIKEIEKNFILGL